MTTGALSFQNPFVGREPELRIYRQFLASHTQWVLCIIAQGGVGKTTLLRHYAEQTPESALAVPLNFAIDSLRVDPLRVLVHIAERVEVYCSPERMQHFRDTLDRGQASLLQLSNQMSQHITVGNNSKFEGQGMQLNISAVLQEKRREVRNQVTGAFSQLLLSLEHNHLVLLLDTCEWFNEPEGLEVGKWFLNEVLPHMHERLQPRRKLSVIIASRMKPTLSAIERQDSYTMSLPMLKKAEVEAYFEQIGMHDSVLRQRIFDITYGHALCVSIIGSLWQEQGEHPFTLAEFPKLQDQFNERALLEFVQERLDQRLVAPYRELTHYGVLLQTFNLPLLQAVFPDLLPDNEASDRFQQLLRYPYVEPRGNQQYAFHSLLREIQAVYIREQEPETWQEYHRRALVYLDSKSPHPAEWYYHAIAYDEEQGMSEWEDAVQEAQLIGTREQLTALLQAVDDKTLSLSPASRATRAHLQGRFYYYGAQMSSALASYEQALGLFRQVGSKLGEAKVLQAMGDVQQFRKDMKEALASYEQALGLFRQVGDRLGEANVLQAMGDVQQFRDEREEALASYEQALGLFRQVGDRLGEANCYLAQGRVALQQEAYDEALTLHTNAYHLYQHIQDGYSQARLLFYRSLVYEEMANVALAIQDIEAGMLLAERLSLPFVDLFRERLEELRAS